MKGFSWVKVAEVAAGILLAGVVIGLVTRR